MMEAVRTSETSVDNHFTWQYNPEDSSEHRVKVTLYSGTKTFTAVLYLQGNKKFLGLLLFFL
jgi:hypothetical protein